MRWGSVEGDPEGIPGAQRAAPGALARELGHLLGCFQLLFIYKIEFFLPGFPPVAQGLQPLATDIVLIYLMLHAWVTGFVQWGVADSPSLLGWMCDSPPQRCALIPSQAAQLHVEGSGGISCPVSPGSARGPCWGRFWRKPVGAVGSAQRGRALG